MHQGKYLVTGSKGLLGSSFLRYLEKSSIDYLGIDRSICDLSNYEGLLDVVQKYKPNTIINCAAYVGGIKANSTRQFDFYINKFLLYF